METELATYEEAPPAPLSKEELLAQVRVIQEVMNSVMRKGEHYGTVPGCGPKPTLLKAGAEKLMHTFRLAPDPEVLPLYPADEDKIAYRVVCRITSTHTGRFLGSGVGECSSEEEKYKWRSAVCAEEFDQTNETERRLKFKKDGITIKQVRTNPHDQANTILKMAKKRALVDAVLTVCAASDLFTQDVEEMEHVGDGTTQTEKTKKAQGPPPREWVIGQLTKFQVKPGKTGNRTWKRRLFTFQLVNNALFEIGCLHLPEGWDDEILKEYAQSNNLLAFKWDENNQGYRELIALAPYVGEESEAGS